MLPDAAGPVQPADAVTDAVTDAIADAETDAVMVPAAGTGGGGLTGIARSPRFQVVLITGARMVSSVFGVIVPIVVVRLLDPLTFGYYKEIFLVTGTVLPLLTLGIPASLYYLAPRYGQADQRLFRHAAILLSTAGVVAGILLFAFGGVLQRVLHAPFKEYAWGIALFTALSLPAGLLPIAPMVDGRARLTALLLASTDMLRSVLVVTVALATRSLGAIVTAAAASMGVQAVLALGYIAWRGRGRRLPGPPGMLSEQLRYALPFAGSSILGLSRDKLHAYFIATAFTPVQFAVYAVAILNLPFIDQLTQTVGEVVILQTAAPFAEGELAEVRRVWHGATQALAVALTPVFVFAEVFATDIIVVLFGARYAEAAPIFRVYLLSLTLAIPLAPAMFRAARDLSAMIIADLLSLLVSIGVLVVFGRRIGPVAGALSLVAGIATFTFVGAWRLARRLRLGWTNFLPWLSIATLMLIAAITGGASWFALVATRPAVRLFLGGALASLAYLALVWRVGLVAPSERALVERWLDRIGLARLAVLWPAGRIWR